MLDDKALAVINYGIRIYVKPVMRGGFRPNVKIIIEQNGIEQIGKIEYKQDEAWEKIEQLYENIYLRLKNDSLIP